MLHNIQPNRKKSKEGGLTKTEQSFVKGLLNMGYSSQDIVHIINQGRPATINLARITEVKKNNNKAKEASKDEVLHFIKIQSSYDPKTLLNPYKDQRLIRAREAMVSAVQIFNSPTILFKTEIFCVLSNIAWTYLIHEKMERTKQGSTKLNDGKSCTVSWLLDKPIFPIKNDVVKENLRKVIEIRDAVEHSFFVGGEECFGALFQANCVNFERHMTEWFGKHLSLAKELSLALQFVRLKKEQIVELESSNLPEKIRALSTAIQQHEYSENDAFQFNVYYTSEVSSKTNADLHKLVSYEESSDGIITAIKKQNFTKLSQSEVVKKVNALGYKEFTSYKHQLFWQEKWPTQEIRNKKATDFGEVVLKNQWQWYEQTWLPEVIKHCKSIEKISSN